MDKSGGIIEAIPKRLGIYCILFVFGVAGIAASEYAYYQLPVVIKTLHLTSFPALDIAERNSALNWLTSLFLLMSAAFAWANYRLCVKFSDPISLSQTWFWTAASAMFMSLDIQTGLYFVIRELLVSVCGTPVYEDGSILPLGLYGFLFGLIALRIIFNLKNCLPAVMFLMLAVAGAAVYQSLPFGFIPFPVPLSGERERLMIQVGLPAFSALCLLMSVALFARRQVFRDPDIMLRWIAQSWNHPPLLKVLEEKVKPQLPLSTFSKTALLKPGSPNPPSNIAAKPEAKRSAGETAFTVSGVSPPKPEGKLN
ncbi:MAG: hypothetical protein LBT46_03405 [Planctomycetaceae bacterium]|jgi:hypothetical protein|nr:hypothetical protein [Planctomycetaceae bacterium]